MPPSTQSQLNEKKISTSSGNVPIASNQSTLSAASAHLLRNNHLAGGGTTAAEFASTLEQLDNELRKVSGVQADVTAVLSGAPHLIHALNQTFNQGMNNTAPIPQAGGHVQQLAPAVPENHTNLDELKSKLSLISKHPGAEHSDAQLLQQMQQASAQYSQSQQAPGQRQQNVLSRAGSVVPPHPDETDALQQIMAAAGIIPNTMTSTGLISNVQLESFNDLASALHKVSLTF